MEKFLCCFSACVKIKQKDGAFLSVRFKRIIAFIIDWNICLFPFVFLVSFSTSFVSKQFETNSLVTFFSFLFFIFPFVVFILRDVIFKGRSLGKRIFGLYIYDKNSLGKTHVNQCILRNIFFFVYFIDVIILLVTGQTIGDRVAGTLVMSEQNAESYNKELQNNSSATKKEKLKKVILIFAIVISCLIAFIGLTQILLNAQKNTEEYKIAYSYFIESNAFEELNVDESKIRFNKYNLNTYTSPEDASGTQTAKLGFVVKHQSFEVVCHKENGIWQVCNECTLFE